METLELTFVTEAGKNLRITIDNPVSPLDPAQVKQAMEEIIAANVFVDVEGNGLVEAKSARIVARQVTPIEIN